MKKDDKRRKNESGKEFPLEMDDPFSPDDAPRREFFYRQDGSQMPTSGSSCRIRKSYAFSRGHKLHVYDCDWEQEPSNEGFEDPLIEEFPFPEEKDSEPQEPAFGSGCRIRKSYDRERDHTSYHYDCGEGLLPSNEIFGEPCIEEKAPFPDRDRFIPSAPRLGSLSANNEVIKYEDLFPEPVEDLEKNLVFDIKEEERPFNEMLRALGSKDSTLKSNSQVPREPFHDEQNYRGCPISERRIFHLRDQLDACSNDFSDDDFPHNPLEREIALAQGALDSVFDFFEDLVVEEDAQYSFSVSKQDEKKEAHVEQVQLIQLEWSKELSELCHLAKNLYNHANYYVRKLFFYKQGKINELGKAKGVKLYNLVKFSEHYRKLPAQTASQVLQYLISNWKKYVEAVQKWYEDPSVFPGNKKPRIPGYKPSKGEFIVVFPIHSIRGPGYCKHFRDSRKVQQWRDKNGNLHSKKTAEVKFPKKAGISPVRIRTNVNGLELDLEMIKEFRISPRGNHYLFQVVYEKKIENFGLDPRQVIGVDLGVNNLLTIANNFGAHPIIVKGKRIKHANWLGNKWNAKIQQELFERLDEKLLFFLDSYRNNNNWAFIIQTFNYLLENRLWDEGINRTVIHHINALLSINGKLKESSKKYFRNYYPKTDFDFDVALLGAPRVQEIEHHVEEIARFTLEYENIRIRNWRNRNNRMQDQIHKASCYLIDYCKRFNVGRIIIGYNKGWKQGPKLGKKTTQNFVYIPFLDLVEKIEYKAKLVGIEVLRVNESHTSKCSALDFEPIGHHDIYDGKRIKRGLYRSKDGLYINADVNGAFNILRSGFPGILDRYRYNEKNLKLMLLSPISVAI